MAALRVLYVPLDEAPARMAAWRWLAGAADIVADRAAAADLDPDLLHRTRALWLDAAPGTPLPTALQTLLTEPPTGLLLTGGAAAWPHLAGIEPVAPGVVWDTAWRHAEDDLFFFDFTETPHLRGHAAFLEHPLFQGLGSATFTWRPAEGEPLAAVMYQRPAWPRHGHVIAVERAYIHINPERATIWEYAPPGCEDRAPRRIVCIGAHLPFHAADPVFERNLYRLATNALARAAGAPPAHAPAERFWRVHSPGAHHDTNLGQLVASDLPGATPEPLSFAAAPLHLDGGDPEDPFTLAGRRAMAAGTAGDGVAELWTHPVRILKDFQVGAPAEKVTVTALGVQRQLMVGRSRVTERIMVPHESPGMVLEWQVEDPGADPIDLQLTWETDFRLMWPYPAGALGPLAWHVHGATLVLATAEPDFTARVRVAGTIPDWEIQDASDDRTSRIRCNLRLPLHTGVPASLTITANPRHERLVDVMRAGAGPAAQLRARAAGLRRLQRERLRIHTPDPHIDQAIEWAKVRLDSYLVDAPGVGRSLVAGYWRASEGWGDGRPGYSWFFGRDAVWTALASLAMGDFEAPRIALDFLSRHQDQSGKILHECTTSGAVHYDAADATPLYLLLAARYLAWTGDRGTLRSLWPAIRRAFDFCLSTDTDGDGLIENPGVGHGWIEFGPLGGGAVTYYNAGIWTAALQELALTATTLGERDFATLLERRARQARRRLEELFYDPAEGRYALKAWQESVSGSPATLADAERASAAGDDAADVPALSRGRAPDTGALVAWRRDLTPTATHAVPLLLDVADPEKARTWLEDVAGNGFSAPWGVRMVPADHPLFEPGSYHGGAVWPLYTGWVAWAEFQAGRTTAALRHWRANIDLCFERARGAWDEVLHGTERRGVGVCPDQAWSTAMAVAPLVYGLLGADPDAPRNRLRLRPQLPMDWAEFRATQLRLGDARIDFLYRRSAEGHTFRVQQTGGAVPVTLILEACMPAQRLSGVRVDGHVADLDARPFGERLLVPVQLILDHERTVELSTEEA